MSNFLPSFPYGAVYYRRSNPPREDWERDYRTAAEDGMNTFRHWFLWSAIEIAPGQYDWEPYDRQLDLAAANGMKTVIAEMITAAPEWAFRRFAHARYETAAGRPLESGMSGSCATGGFPGLCLDNDDYRAVAEAFLRALVTRYRGHPGLGGYDVWNECNIRPDTCYCPATAAAFRRWLLERYDDLRTVAERWHRYSLAEWEDITPPRELGPYPHVLDWLQFRIDNAYRWMRWRVELIRGLDPDHPITAHGVAGTLTSMADHAADDWRAAAEVESYGLTWVACRKGDEPWKQWHAVDLTRAASRGKRFWHSEAQGGPLWMQPQLPGRPRDDGRIPDPQDLRYWHLLSFAGGATGLLYPRWRPLLDGPLFGAFGPYALDGSRTPRSAMSSDLARWANAPEQAALWRSRPVRGEVGIVYVPETQLMAYAQQGHTAYYAQSMQGAYRGFLAHNIQADWVHLDDIAQYDLLYLPFPFMLSHETADALRNWVAAGGTLVSEGCPAYFGDGGHVGTIQPNYGLDELFGARESSVEFTPDLLGDLRVDMGGTPVWGGLFMQAYRPTTGEAVGWYEDGQVAVVDNRYGQGKTRLIGTMAGAGYYAHGVTGGHDPDGPAPFYAQVLAYGSAYGGVEQHVISSDPSITARLHSGAGGDYLWVANPTRQPRPVQLRLGSAWGPYRAVRSLWGAEASVTGQCVTLVCPERDVCVLALS